MFFMEGEMKFRGLYGNSTGDVISSWGSMALGKTALVRHLVKLCSDMQSRH